MVFQDEPTSGLDSNGATDLVQMLKVASLLHQLIAQVLSLCVCVRACVWQFLELGLRRSTHSVVYHPSALLPNVQRFR
jgi:hypothetical protein